MILVAVELILNLSFFELFHVEEFSIFKSPLVGEETLQITSVKDSIDEPKYEVLIKDLVFNLGIS